MCNRYFSPAQLEIDAWWKLDQQDWWIDHEDMIFPRKRGPFIRRALDDTGYSRQGVVGDWGLIPWFAKERVLKYSTNRDRLRKRKIKHVKPVAVVATV